MCKLTSNSDLFWFLSGNPMRLPAVRLSGTHPIFQTNASGNKIKFLANVQPQILRKMLSSQSRPQRNLGCALRSYGGPGGTHLPSIFANICESTSPRAPYSSEIKLQKGCNSVFCNGENIHTPLGKILTKRGKSDLDVNCVECSEPLGRSINIIISLGRAARI